MQYVANLDDCIINVDAKDANVEIVLPQFINYQQSNLISIKKIDSSNHSVTVRANQLTKSLKDQNEQLQIQWTQPFFMNGQWQIAHS
ncbi:TPA: hypothetical protein ACPSJ3_002775, partial [Legionella anisa]